MAVVRTGQDKEPRPLVNQTYDVYPVPRTRSKRARLVTSFTDETRAVNDSFQEMFVTNWDARVASEQAMSRIAPRRDMGQKKTPRGPGVHHRLSPPK